ncbi:glycogen/starch/alpha-glucan phosphorylase [Thermocoleostomius sinensis]|uniref:Alpha-1,4 glucan phosphorylase n=1 Tax=Thermocoleostomius sinensis A174 TaxID=2016057 RepID=A0A9E9C7J8_9CYAN|nr:glycogen/starch/alpha-glucan phosphorylase [Thermocoleostomius sinensis]WAL60439.1 glycogen/starch/alpha-glucan phosphorylase [Thermocoleostomius sinensis A174]
MNDFNDLWILPVVLLGLGVFLMSHRNEPAVDENLEMKSNSDHTQRPDGEPATQSLDQKEMIDESIEDLEKESSIETSVKKDELSDHELSDQSSIQYGVEVTDSLSVSDDEVSIEKLNELTIDEIQNETLKELPDNTNSIDSTESNDRLSEAIETGNEQSIDRVATEAGETLSMELEDEIPEIPKEEISELGCASNRDSGVEIEAAMPSVADVPAQPTTTSKLPITESTVPSSTSTLRVKVPPLGDRTTFQAARFQQAFTEALSQQGQTLTTVTPQVGYSILASMVQEQLRLLSSPDRSQAERITVQVAIDIPLDQSLESYLLNLGVLESVRQAFDELNLNLDALLTLRTSSPPQLSDWQAQFVTDALEALTTAQLPAIGYCLRQDSNTNVTLWEIQRPEHQVTVAFGGDTQLYTGRDGRLRVRWTPQDTITAIPYDALISGYAAKCTTPLRRWQIKASRTTQANLEQVDSGAIEVPKSLAVASSNEEKRLQQHFVLVACVVADVMRLHQQSGLPIDTLPKRVAIHLNGTATGLAIVELMRWLIDEFDLEWAAAWRLTQQTFSGRFQDDIEDDRWSIAVLERLLPRHLEIIYEINRRFLDELNVNGVETIERIRQLSLIDEEGDRSLRVHQLIYLGCCSVYISTLSLKPLSASVHSLVEVSDSFSEWLKAKIKPYPISINARRYLLQANSSLAALITQWIGESWITNTEYLKQLEGLVQDRQFCAEWWQVRRTLKQNLIHLIQQQADSSIPVNSLIDVQVAPIGIASRQLLNILHIITLYIRLKVNSSTDTIQHFTHRSVPRSCILVGNLDNDDAMASSILYLIRSVATTINNDPDVQGKLQVIVLEQPREPILRALYAADVIESLARADQAVMPTTPLGFALNGALTIGTLTQPNLELQQAVGGKNCFLFGMTATTASTLTSQGYVPASYYSRNADLKQAIDAIASGYFSFGDTNAFKALGNWLFTQDPGLVLADYEAYMDCQERVSQSFQDQKHWTRMSILTTARMASLLTDRVVAADRDS